MKIECPSCSFSKDVDDNELPDKPKLNVSCPKCNDRFSLDLLKNDVKSSTQRDENASDDIERATIIRGLHKKMFSDSRNIDIALYLFNFALFIFMLHWAYEIITGYSYNLSDNTIWLFIYIFLVPSILRGYINDHIYSTLDVNNGALNEKEFKKLKRAITFDKVLFYFSLATKTIVVIFTIYTFIFGANNKSGEISLFYFHSVIEFCFYFLFGELMNSTLTLIVANGCILFLLMFVFKKKKIKKTSAPSIHTEHEILSTADEWEERIKR